jgi:recombinational DNA repair protein RecR
MASTPELVDAILQLLAQSQSAPVALANHNAELGRLIISEIVERAAARGISISEIEMGMEFGEEMGFIDGGTICPGLPTTARFEADWGRQLIFNGAEQ